MGSQTSSIQGMEAKSALLSTQQTTCCIVGSGPAGAVLALLLARQGIPVTLLEAQKDFEREFRADTIHPYILELMDDLGLIDRLHKFRHTKMHSLGVETADGPVTFWDFRRLNIRYPYMMVVPQSHFLELLTSEAQRYPDFRLVMGARVDELLQEDGTVRGVRYRNEDGRHEVQALLTVGADGRGSIIRRLAGREPTSLAEPMDLLWFRLPHKSGDLKKDGFALHFKPGHLIIYFDRFEYWQLGYHIPHGSFRAVRAAGMETFRRNIAETIPLFADRVEFLQEWNQITLLTVQLSSLDQWYQSGLLLIGDAAHVMTPIGAVGVNLAVQDAVAAANILSQPLRKKQLRLEHLARIQRQRAWVTRIIQRWQKMSQRQTIGVSFEPTKPFRLPLAARLMFRLPFLRDLPPRLVGFGLRPTRLDRRLVNECMSAETITEPLIGEYEVEEVRGR